MRKAATRQETQLSPQAGYQARRRAVSAPVTFFPSDKGALDWAVRVSGMTQQAWLVAVVDAAIKDSGYRITSIEVTGAVTPVPDGERPSGVHLSGKVLEHFSTDWLARVPTDE